MDMLLFGFKSAVNFAKSCAVDSTLGPTFQEYGLINKVVGLCTRNWIITDVVCFYKHNYVEIHQHRLVYVLSVDAFMLQWQT